MHVEVSWLDKLIHKVDRFGLLKTNLITSSLEHVVYFQSTIHLEVVVQNESNDPTLFLLDDDIKSHALDCNSGNPSEVAEAGLMLFMDSSILQVFTNYITDVIAPSDLVGLSDGTNLDTACDESHLFVSKS